MSKCVVRRPLAATAVAILSTDGGVDDARLSDALAANGVAVVCVPSDADFALGMQVADTEFGPLLPRMVAASGSSVPQAQRAARRAGLSSAVLLNAPLGRSVGHRSMETMVFVDRAMLSTRVWGRLASRLGNASYRVVDASFEAPLRSWLANPQAVVRDPLGSTTAVAALIAAVTLVAAPLLPMAASASAAAPAPAHAAQVDPFANGVRVGTHQIKGERALGARPAPSKDDSGDGKKVSPKAIQGDGSVSATATGSKKFISANHLKWFVNTNITFATTSSATGAMSEASFTQSIPVTTSAGGTVAAKPNDAFDGYNSLFVDVAGTTLAKPANTYNQNGAATDDPNCVNEQVIFPIKSMQGLDVSRMVYVPADGDFARWMNTFTNPTDTAITVGVGTGNNVGSDNNTIITGSSNADTTADLTDTWIGTMQNYSGTTSGDVRLAHVIQGPGAPVTPSAVHFVPGDDNPYWAWDITVQPGETVSLMNFAVGEPSKAAANAGAGELAALTPSGDGTVPGLRCLTDAQVGSIRNFAVPDVSVASLSVNEAAGPAMLTFSRTSSGAAATVTFSLTAGSATLGDDYSNPSPLTATFAAGATTAQVAIPIVNDTVVEGDETVAVAITGVSGYGQVSASGANAVLTIVSDDVAPTTMPPLTMPPDALLPTTGGSSTPLGWIAALFAAFGAAMIGATRRRTTD